MHTNSKKEEESSETLGYLEFINDGRYQKYFLFFKNYEDAKKSFEEHKNGFIDANKDKNDLEANVLIDMEQEWLCRYVNKSPTMFARHEVEIRVAFLKMKADSCINIAYFV